MARRDREVFEGGEVFEDNDTFDGGEIVGDHPNFGNRAKPRVRSATTVNAMTAPVRPRRPPRPRRTATERARAARARAARQRGKGWRPGSIEIFTGLLLLVILFRSQFVELFSTAAMQTWATVFVAIVVQALPFLVVGVIISALIAVFVPQSFFERVLPRKPALAVPVAGISGVALPGCECSSVPIAGALVRRGMTPAAAFAFLLSAPAINPIVLVATAVAFPDNPEMVVARFAASALAAIAMGWLWLAVGRSEWIKLPPRPDLSGMSKFAALASSARHDFIHAGGFLVIGGITAAALKVVIPPSWLEHLADNPVLALAALAALAVVLSICSEADAFVAASLTQFSLSARLTFLVVGPMIDLKLFAMQLGTFGRGFALRFAPATLFVAIGASVLVGWLLL